MNNMQAKFNKLMDNSTLFRLFFCWVTLPVSFPLAISSYFVAKYDHDLLDYHDLLDLLLHMYLGKKSI